MRKLAKTCDVNHFRGNDISHNLHSDLSLKLSRLTLVQITTNSNESIHDEYHASIQSRHFMYKKGRVNSNSRIISTDEDPSLRIESSAIINLLGVSTKLNKYDEYHW